MTIQTIGAINRAQTMPPPRGTPNPMALAPGKPSFNIPLEDLRRLVADMVD